MVLGQSTSFNDSTCLIRHFPVIRLTFKPTSICPTLAGYAVCSPPMNLRCIQSTVSTLVGSHVHSSSSFNLPIACEHRLRNSTSRQHWTALSSWPEETHYASSQASPGRCKYDLWWSISVFMNFFFWFLSGEFVTSSGLWSCHHDAHNWTDTNSWNC